MAFTWIRGRLAVVGYQPDGDSVRFIPDRLATVRPLRNGARVDPSERDGSMQLRLDAIDAPETHYEDAGKRTTLSALITQDGDRVALTAAIPDLVFVED